MNSFCLAVMVFAASVAADDLLVQTASGKVRGQYIKDATIGTEYNAYTCIPYAKPPINELRFAPPAPVDSWEVTREPQLTCSVCPQFEYITRNLIGSEDCLFLNVYVPAHPTSEVLPVMLWIQGGEWRTHGGSHELYNPSFMLSKKNVILVTMNFRLGPLGFLSTGDEIVPGNNGLKDQSLVLRWIQENIEKFGGNPEEVTLFGSSTGAASVRYHMISPMSKGLFRAGISQSGNELDTWAWQSTAEATSLFRRLTDALGCSSLDDEVSVDCLKQLSANSIIAAEGSTFAEDLKTKPLMIFKPVTEVPNENAFLSENPVDILKRGEYNDVPMILGVTAEDGRWVHADYWVSNHNGNVEPSWILPTSSPAFRLGYAKKQSVAAKVYDRYIKDFVGGDPIKLRDSTIEMISDAWFRSGHETLLTYKRETQSANIFQYRLAYNGEFSFSEWLGHPDQLEVGHYDDEIYLFPSNIYFNHVNMNANDTDMWQKFVELWVHFATHLTPTPTSASGVTWAPVSSSAHEYLDIRGPTDLSMESSMNEERTRFWNALSCEYVFDSVHCL